MELDFLNGVQETMANKYNMKYEDIIKFFYKDVEINFKEN